MQENTKARDLPTSPNKQEGLLGSLGDHDEKYTTKMFARDLPGGNLRRKTKMTAQLKIRRCNVITLRN